MKQPKIQTISEGQKCNRPKEPKCKSVCWRRAPGFAHSLGASGGHQSWTNSCSPEKRTSPGGCCRPPQHPLLDAASPPSPATWSAKVVDIGSCMEATPSSRIPRRHQHLKHHSLSSPFPTFLLFPPSKKKEGANQLLVSTRYDIHIQVAAQPRPSLRHPPPPPLLPTPMGGASYMIHIHAAG